MVVAHQVAIALFLRKTVINTRTKVTVAETVALEIEAEITQGKVAGMVDEEDGSATTDFKGEVLTPSWQHLLSSCRPPASSDTPSHNEYTGELVAAACRRFPSHRRGTTIVEPLTKSGESGARGSSNTGPATALIPVGVTATTEFTS
ncbi:hypothetical protein PC118_g4590 [Phytophthora cactorum]|uniref:Uncharacterized protein n=1 Tax=Phytophthora cactorum TaxID=29920 RepID=A0A8T1GEK7_9STRA|nr:hypothetical protein PC118_g4590 [Phytophthora cactorum]